MDINSQSWKHIFEIPFPRHIEFNYTIFNNIDCKGECGIFSATLLTLETFEHELQDYFQNHTSLLDLLIPEEDDSKVKRGLIDIGGTILKGLFGLSTEDDLNKLHNFVSKIANREIAV